MNDAIKRLLGTSPRTTIVGFLKAAFVAMLPIFQKDGFDITKDWPYLIGALLLLIGGRLQKDSNGITREQSKIVAKMATDGLIPPAKIEDETAIV